MSLKKLFIYFWLCWVFVAVRGLSLVEASRRYSSLQCMGFSLQWLLLLRSTGSNCTVFSHCGASQGSNLCPLHWQVDSYPLYHQGNPWKLLNSSPRWLCHLTSPAAPGSSWAPAPLRFCGRCPHRVPVPSLLDPDIHVFPLSLSRSSAQSQGKCRSGESSCHLGPIVLAFGSSALCFPGPSCSCVRSPRSSAQLSPGSPTAPCPWYSSPEADCLTLLFPHLWSWVSSKEGSVWESAVAPTLDQATACLSLSIYCVTPLCQPGLRTRTPGNQSLKFLALVEPSA